MDEEAEKKKQEEEEKKKETLKDNTIQQVFMDTAQRKKNTFDGAEDVTAFDEALQLGDLENNKDGEDVLALLEKLPKLCLRYADEKGEMPLHKLARCAKLPPNATPGIYRKICKLIFERMRDQCAAAKRPLASDINHQDKLGKTPLYIAVDYENIEMIDLLYSLRQDGPDSLLVNSAGWTVCHAAAHKASIPVLEALFRHYTPARKKLLLNTKDKAGRTPLHIVSFKEESDDNIKVAKQLIQHGAKNDTQDAAGNVPSQLALFTRRNRMSKEIEEGTGQVPSAPEVMPAMQRRRSRDSVEAPPKAPAAA